MSGTGRCPAARLTRKDCEALDDSDEAAESMEWLRIGGVGRVSGRFGREGGGMVTTGDAGGEKPADGGTGSETFRSGTCEDDFVDVRPPNEGRAGGAGKPGWVVVVVAAGDGWCCSSSAIRASSF
jgi:hypothetical protein